MGQLPWGSSLEHAANVCYKRGVLLECSSSDDAVPWLAMGTWLQSAFGKMTLPENSPPAPAPAPMPLYSFLDIIRLLLCPINSLPTHDGPNRVFGINFMYRMHTYINGLNRSQGFLSHRQM